jgi:UDP-GlcNAc:undecaprenyl-phosphate GlcNAc-1-phosphate transferase
MGRSRETRKRTVEAFALSPDDFLTHLDLIAALPMMAALVLSLALTPVVIYAARRLGMVAQPRVDRWHRKPTAMLGGMAVMLAVVGGFLFSDPSPKMQLVLAVSVGMCILGLVDDILHIKPYQKLVVQILAAAIVIGAGLTLPWTSSITVNMVVTMFWLIGITNALNLLDNMDGLASGIAIIASLFLALNFYLNGQSPEAVLLLIFAAALLGFLVYNFDPASVFMGDCGSMFIGFFLAACALLSSTDTVGRTRSLLPVLAVPVLIFGIPIFDTTFVTVVRKLSGRAASQGGRDHTSHRLVALGMTERSAVLMLYLFAILSGLVALAARRMQLDVSMAITTAFVIALTLGGVHLASVKVYTDDTMGKRNKILHSFLVDLSYKRRVFEVLLDTVLVMLAYYLAYLSLFGPFSLQSRDWQLFMQTAPLVVGAMMVSFLAVGVYRGVWRYTSLSDLGVIVKAVVTGSLTSLVLVGFAFQFAGFSRAVFVLTAMFLVAEMAIGRLSFRVIKRRRVHPFPEAERRVMIYGAGDAGERVLRELLSNSDLPYLAVGFLDDDLRKTGRMIHGLRVYQGHGSIAAHCRKLGAEEVIISNAGFGAVRVNEIWTECKSHNISLSRVSVQFERVAGLAHNTRHLADSHIVVDSPRISDSVEHISR